MGPKFYDPKLCHPLFSVILFCCVFFSIFVTLGFFSQLSFFFGGESSESQLFPLVSPGGSLAIEASEDDGLREAWIRVWDGMGYPMENPCLGGGSNIHIYSIYFHPCGNHQFGRFFLLLVAI